jgi:hypothetical protein
MMGIQIETTSTMEERLSNRGSVKREGEDDDDLFYHDHDEEFEYCTHFLGDQELRPK